MTEEFAYANAARAYRSVRIVRFAYSPLLRIPLDAIGLASNKRGERGEHSNREAGYLRELQENWLVNASMRQATILSRMSRLLFSAELINNARECYRVERSE